MNSVVSAKQTYRIDAKLLLCNKYGWKGLQIIKVFYRNKKNKIFKNPRLLFFII